MNATLPRLVRFAFAPAFAGVVALSSAGCYVESGPPVAYATTDPPPPPEGVVVEAPPPPPPVIVEAPPPAPGPEFVWIGGYHHWNGYRYVWVRGRYERRPHPRARWVAPHWEARGRGHVWIGGRWD
jgi:hypothetical protein